MRTILPCRIRTAHSAPRKRKRDRNDEQSHVKLSHVSLDQAIIPLPGLRHKSDRQRNRLSRCLTFLLSASAVTWIALKQLDQAPPSSLFAAS